MKRFLSLICLIVLALLLPAAAMISRGLPADTHPYVEKKYAGWSGVLRAWVCAEWEPGGSLVRWLNSCAASFEKRHEGVYIEFTPVSREAMRAMGDSGIRPPELVFFGPGVLTSPEGLRALEAPEGLRPELAACGGGFACPVAMGGYIWVYNRALCPEGFAPPGAPVMLPDDGGRSFSAALVALMSGEDGAPEEADEALPDAELDLGLSVHAAAGADSGAQGAAPEIAADALDRFIAGELAALPVSQRELSRLIRLRDAGRGPDWNCAATGECAYTDQLLLAAVVQGGEDGAAREALAAEFIALLAGEEMQTRLAEAGAFSVTGARVYSDFSAYAALDGLLNGRVLLASDGFSECSARDCGDIVRDLYSGRLRRSAAAEALKARLNLQNVRNP